MSELRMPWRVPRIDLVALVGVAVGFGLYERTIVGFVLLPLALLAPFVLRELGVVDDDERVREAWRRAGFWAFALVVGQAFVMYGVWLVRGDGGGIVASLGPVVHVWALKAPVILFIVVYGYHLAGAGAGARVALWVFALLVGVELMARAVYFTAHGVSSGLQQIPYRLPVVLAFLVLGFLAPRRPRLTGWLVVCLSVISAGVWFLVLAPQVTQPVVTPGIEMPVRVDASFPILASNLAINLVLLVLGITLIRPNEEGSS